MSLKFQVDVAIRLSRLTLGEYEAKSVRELCSVYKVAPITLQRYAASTFHVERKPIASKLPGRYGDIDWTLNDTQIARLLAVKKGVPADNMKKAISSTRERVRQLREILNKPRSPNYKGRAFAR